MNKVPTKVGFDSKENPAENNSQVVINSSTSNTQSPDFNQITKPGVFNSEVISLNEFRKMSKTMNIDDFSILQFNVRGITEVDDFNKIKEILESMEVKFDLIVLGETNLLENKNYKIDNYKDYPCCRDSTNPGGGLLVFIHKDIDIEVEEIPNVPTKGSFEKIKIELKDTNILCYYRRSESYKFDEFVKDLEMEMRICGDKKMIIVGDVNLSKLRYASEQSNSKMIRRKYLLLLECYNFHIMNNAATRNETGKIIDHLTINFKNECNIRNYTIEIPSDISDHNMVLSIISKVNPLPIAEYKFINIKKMQNIFKNQTEEKKLLTKEDPAEVINLLIQILDDAIRKSTREVKSKKQIASKKVIFISNKIKVDDYDEQEKEIDYATTKLVKLVIKQVDPYIQLINQISLSYYSADGQAKKDKMLNTFNEYKSTLSCRIIQNIVCKNFNNIFNGFIKKLDKSNEILKTKYNETISACDLWQYIQDKLDINNNYVLITSLDIKNNFNPENMGNLFQNLYSEINEQKLGELYSKLKGIIFLYGNNYILLNNLNNLTQLVKNFQHDMKKICEFLNKMNFELNFQETHFMFLTTRNQMIACEELEIKNSDDESITITKTDTIKYLGLFISENKNWDKHIDVIVRKTAPAVGYLWKLKKKSFEEKKKIYIELIEKPFKNLIPIWGYQERKDYLERLCWIQNMALRIVYNKNGTLYEDMFTDESNQLEIYLENTENFLPLRGLYFVETINLINDIVNGNIESNIISKLDTNNTLTPKKFRLITPSRSLNCLGIILRNKFPNVQDLKTILLNDESFLSSILNSEDFKIKINEYIAGFRKKK